MSPPERPELPPDAPPEPGVPVVDLLERDDVVVPRRSLRELVGAAIGVLVGGFIGLGSFLWFAHEQSQTNDELHQTQAQLADVVRGEAREEEVEQAEECVSSHRFIEALGPLVLDVALAGARAGTDAHLNITGATDAERHEAHEVIEQLVPQEVGPIIDRFPPPTCDREAAQRVLDEATTEERDTARGGR